MISQSIDTTIVKYFQTDLTRSILLKDGIDEKKIKKGAYFKATYDGSGDLIKIEYIPSKRDKGIIDTVKTRTLYYSCLLYTSPSPRDRTRSRMPSSA